MKSFIRLTDFSKQELLEIFKIADSMEQYEDFLKGKTVVMFFPTTSIRTRVAFEKGIYLLGGQVILFDPTVLDKKEDIVDVCGYLNNWADVVVVRHRDIRLLEKMRDSIALPVINAMTDDNHPCEMMSDLYTLSKIRSDYLQDKYLFVGADGNIGSAWKEASKAFNLSLSQCCPEKYRMTDVPYYSELQDAVLGKDIICTDSIPSSASQDFKSCQITSKIMALANKDAVLNPCPPFFRGEEVSEDVIDSKYFVGYGFKKSLLVVQQAIMVYCMTH